VIDATTVTIDRLRLTYTNVHGQEHRIAPISRQAIAVFQQMLAQRLLEIGNPIGQRHLDRAAAGATEIDLLRMGDKEASRRIAQQLVGAFVQHLKT
jgi:hypothetical protein